MKRACLGLLLAATALLPAASRLGAQSAAGAVRFGTPSLADLRQWDAVVDRMARDGELRLRDTRPDTLLEGRAHARFDQYHEGVKIFGADVARQTDRDLTVSVFGTLYDVPDVDTTPTIATADARAIVERLAGRSLPASYEPELVVLPRAGGGFVLTYLGRAFGSQGPRLYFIDARSGALVHTLSDLKTQSEVGIGTGVLGDQKKLSVLRSGAEYRADDEKRPPRIATYDLKGNLARTIGFLEGLVTLTPSDLGLDTDNTWTDPAVVDAHAYVGWVYDFYFKRFGRRGLDNRDRAIISIVHPVSRDDAATATDGALSLFYVNAFYAGGGVMVFGEGLPPGMRDPAGRQWNYLAGGLDIIGHELTHGVIDHSSNLIYENESGALNEAFADVMGIAAEFFFQPPGNGLMRAEYSMGEDVISPGAIRAADNPALFDNPDHYSLRYRGDADNGGVHLNATIGTHAYYLAVEGGTNRTSQLSVTGVGAANRDQIDKVFYRAFTQLMPANSTFATARAATIQAARDLYGDASAARRAVTEAWTAVGVE